ncbi:hypothetical protein G6F57_018282 [Rhizopus arrhizus]|nr:hypothetical protein G6F57_018282 [Rhizopus arrhizus]
MLQVAGFSFVGSGENVGMGFIRLKPWEERKFTAPEFIQNMNGAFYGIKEAQIFVVNLPTVQGLGQFGGFDMWLQDRSGAGYEQLTQARNILLGKAAQKPEALVGVRPNGLENAPQLQLHHHPADAGPGVRQRLLLRGPHQARHDAGRWPVPHGPGVAEELLQPVQPDHQCRWHQRDDPAQHGGQVRMGVGIAIAEPLQRLLGDQHRRFAGPGHQFG